MRLIDADKLPIYSTIEGIEKSEKGTVAIIGNWVSAITIEEAPTVEAIPIEWLKSWAMKNWVKSKKCEYDIIVSKLIEDWEKENERQTDMAE